MRRPRLTLIRIEVDADWHTLIVSLVLAAGLIGVALWLVW